ncbi:MAG: hypothetical protein WBF89_11165 [Steroidobacteraceae bacterium]
MPLERRPPSFSKFARWVAAHQGAALSDREAPEELLAAARQAREEWMLSDRSSTAQSAGAESDRAEVEVLGLLAAASAEASTRPPELMTPRGFRVTLAYEEESAANRSSICVLVRCPPEMIGQVQGGTAFLWYGSMRFELGQFDADGKAIGTLPAGIEITLADFAKGTVKLEAPSGQEDP